MQRFQHILVAVDTRFDCQRMVDEAVALAQQHGASLKLVDVAPELPWTVRLTVSDHSHLSELIRQEKQEKLGVMAVSVRAQGVDVRTQILQGKTSFAIIREVLAGGHDLVLRLAKGTHSRRSGFFGNTGIRLLRQCPCPVLLVAPERTKFRHVLGCVDTSSDEPLDAELNDQVFEFAKMISQDHDGNFSIVHAWSVWNDLFLQRRMDSEEFAAMVSANRAQISKHFDKFLRRHGSSVSADNVHLVEGEPAEAIAKFVSGHGVDLVVMGTVARSGVAGMIMGNTAEMILNRTTCSVLALKPSSFVCPVSLT